MKRREYRRKISGPIADRVDITRFVEPLRPEQQDAAPLPFEPPEPSTSIRLRVAHARQRQRARYAGHPWRLNAQAPGPLLREQWPMSDAAMLRLDTEVYAARLTRRGAVRVHRVAWSVADLAGGEQPGVEELEVALRLRSSTPLLLSSLRRRAGLSVVDETA